MPAIWGQAKIEILALQDEILSKLEQGIPVRTLYSQLSESGRITMSRRSFYDRVKQLRSCASKSSSSTAAKQSVLSNNQNRRTTTVHAQPISSNTLPTLKHQEPTEFDRAWNGDPAEEEASQ